MNNKLMAAADAAHASGKLSFAEHRELQKFAAIEWTTLLAPFIKVALEALMAWIVKLITPKNGGDVNSDTGPDPQP